MIYQSKHIGIIIPTNGNKSILSVLNSIKHQTKKAGQVIVIQNHIPNFNIPKNITLILSKIKNQVYQRSLAKTYVKKNIKIILQLDDYVCLKRNALEELAKEWNAVEINTVGIGLNIVNYFPKKSNILKRFLDHNTNYPGKVLKSGYVTTWGKNFFTSKPDWLNGGSTSWRLKRAKDLFYRRYPHLHWSVSEDVIYSFNKSQKFKLKLSKKARAYYKPRDINRSFKENFNRGLILSKIIKNFVKYNKNLSLFEFYKYTLANSIFGLFFNIIILNFSYTGYFMARIIGCIRKTYNFKIK